MSSQVIDASSLAVAIPTFGREAVLIETLEYLLGMSRLPTEVIVVDQTSNHEAATILRLNEMVEKGSIRLLTQSPSIPRAMNRALMEATTDFVLFVDDDIIPASDLVGQHLNAYQDSNVVAVVGQVLQPGEEPIDSAHLRSDLGLCADLQFCFRSNQPSLVRNVMAGNLSVNRKAALAAGGFDENFVGVAYRFETEFARRLSRTQGEIRYVPNASIRHLAAARGGTRSYGKHLTTHRPEHSVGDYYFALLEGSPVEALRYCARRLVTSVATRFHLKHPWYIPVKLLGEVRGLLWAIQLWMQGQKLLLVASDERREASVNSADQSVG